MRHLNDLYSIIAIQLIFYIIIFVSTYIHLKYIQYKYKYYESITIKKVIEYGGVSYIPIFGIFITIVVIMLFISAYTWEFFTTTKFYKAIQNILNKEI